ncbi:hypothetical protein ACOMHN_050902 [Nucella lapillus]
MSNHLPIIAHDVMPIVPADETTHDVVPIDPADYYARRRADRDHGRKVQAGHGGPTSWRGEETSGGKLAALFSVPASVYSAEPTTPKTAQTEKKKKALRTAEQAEEAASSPPKKKKRAETEDKTKKKSGMMGISGQPPSEGFSPPPGIVHEALMESTNLSGKKRKKPAAGIEDSEDEQPTKRGIKEDKRPRRDRQKKVDEKRTVFVGNVPLTRDKKALTRLFKQFGEIESVRFRCAPVADPSTKKRVAMITKEFHEKRNNISAYVCFKEEEAAKKAVSLNGYLMDGLHLRVDSSKPELKNLNKRSVFVGNLPFAIEEESIRQHFEDCGEIENVRVVRDRKTNLGKGFCYILFKSPDSVSFALHLKDSELEKRQTNRDPRGNKKPKHADRKASKKPINADQKASTKPDQKAKRKKRMWQPTNASSTQIFQSHKTALMKKQRRGEKKKKQRSKVDEVTRVLGPLQQPPAVQSAKSAHARKPKQPNRRKDFKGQKKGKKNVR